jgi:pyruvate-formate lyase-activating enzyme
MKNIHCPIPYTCMTIISGNEAKVCNVGHDIFSSKIDENSNLQNLWYDNIKKKRQEYKNGAIPLYCKKCYENEAIKIKSRRMRFLKFNKHFKFDETEPTLQYLNINFSNICDLDCLMCSSQFSSKWIKNDKELINKFSFRSDVKPYLKINKIPYSFIDQIKINELVFVEIKGGEPFIDPGFIYFLKRFIKEKGTGSIHVTTNLNNLNDEVKKYLSLLPRISIDVSVDAVDDLYQYIRGNNASIKKVKENLKFITNLKGLFSLRINVATTPYNLWDSYKIINWSNNISKKIMINFCVITTDPFYLNPSLIPYSLRREAVNIVENYIKKYNVEKKHMIDLKMILNYLNINNPKNLNKEHIQYSQKCFLEWTDYIDSIRYKNIDDIVPQIKKAKEMI